MAGITEHPMSEILIRPVAQSDLAALTAIYNHYIATTAITFDLEPKTIADRQSWLDAFAPSGRHQCFVAVADGEAVGWACSAKLREKAAYDTSVETSIYVKDGIYRRGLGRRLYTTLFEALATEDVHRAYGCITVPNEPSVAIHLAMGFKLVGGFHEVGRKFGRFWDVAWYEKTL
jgi:phosphinothricin acetyltransferase